MSASSNRPTVDILLATFNGEKYLDAQLQSLAQQEDVNVAVWVNDDGSDDTTLKILLNWKSKGLIKGISETQGIGSTHAFLKLLSEHPESQFVAFCDQDDVWDRRKLLQQVGSLSSEIPMLVASQRIYINEDGTIIGKSRKNSKPPTFENAMVENIVPGNTILMNNCAIKLINSFPNPTIKHYDSWIYLLVSAFGKVEFLHQPLVQYRVHANNTVGLRKLAIKRFTESVSTFVDQVIFLGSKLDSGEHDIVVEKSKMFVRARSERNIFRKLEIIQKIGFKRQNYLDQIVFKLLCLIENRPK